MLESSIVIAPTKQPKPKQANVLQDVSDVVEGLFHPFNVSEILKHHNQMPFLLDTHPDQISVKVVMRPKREKSRCDHTRAKEFSTTRRSH